MPDYHFSLTTPDGRLFDAAIESLVAPGENGSFGMLANHAPMICATQPGVLVLRKDGEPIYFAVGAGMLEASHNEVSLLADAAIKAASREEARDKVKELISPWDTQLQ